MNIFCRNENDENYAREEENEKERTSSYRTYLEQKGENKNDSILRTFYFTFSGGVWSGICSVSESSENECDGDSTDADEQCKDDGNRDTDTGF